MQSQIYAAKIDTFGIDKQLYDDNRAQCRRVSN